jgi:hypothetical protein
MLELRRRGAPIFFVWMFDEPWQLLRAAWPRAEQCGLRSPPLANERRNTPGRSRDSTPPLACCPGRRRIHSAVAAAETPAGEGSLRACAVSSAGGSCGAGSWAGGACWSRRWPPTASIIDPPRGWNACSLPVPLDPASHRIGRLCPAARPPLPLFASTNIFKRRHACWLDVMGVLLLREAVLSNLPVHCDACTTL